jgi:tetratricopeptide (TPR) repeat protein
VNNTVDREAMEAERDFLLRSLDDLDAELLAGNIDPDTYRQLHDDYTARAAEVVRTLDTGRARDKRDPTVARRSPALRVITAGGIVVFCVLAAFLLARAAGERRPGQTITGNDSAAPAPTLDPNSYDARISSARTLMKNRDYPGALKAFTSASEADPQQPEPYAYRGWIAALVARQVEDATARSALVERALNDFDHAIALSPRYVDVYFFKGETLFKLADKPRKAVPALQRFLVLAPDDHPLRKAVLGVLADAQSAASTQP